MTYNEQLQHVWHEYEKEHGYLPARPRDAVVWGAQRGMIEVPDPDPFDKLADEQTPEAEVHRHGAGAPSAACPQPPALPVFPARRPVGLTKARQNATCWRLEPHTAPKRA